MLLLTCSVVENRPLGTAASQVVRQHRHQVGVATLALICAVVAGGVAGCLTAITFFDKGLIAVCVRYRVPRQRAVSY